MSDHWLGTEPGGPHLARLRAALSRRPLFEPLTGAVAAGAVAALALAIGVHYWRTEGLLPNFAFTCGVTAAIAAVLTLTTRRPLFAAVLTTALVVVISVAASIKHATMSMVVHAYDLYFYFSSWSTVSFLWSDHRKYVLALVGSLGALGIIGWVAYRIDGTRVPRRRAAIALALSVAVAWIGAETKGERRHMQFNFANLQVSSFFASWAETLETLWRGQMMEAAAHAKGAPFTVPTTCEMPRKPPHIVLVHQESVVPPGIFPTLAYDTSVDPLFQSHDGRMHRLRVETYGGASWLTEFSILAGVSTQSFGGMRQFVQTFMRGKLKDTLPQVLARCGYRNVVFYPMLRNFVSNDKFYTSIGMGEIIDLAAQGAKSAQERDRFYYDNAIAEMERHVGSSKAPIFTFIQTMSAHWPYDWAFEPDAKVPGGGPGTHPEMHEYLRRVSLAKIDFDHLVAELQRRLPNERVLIVQYGDHHPTATRTLLGFGEEAEAEDVGVGSSSLGFVTYYATRGLNYDVPPLPAVETLDVPYLGSVILDAAGIPLSPSHRARLDLISPCQGRYYTCADRSGILEFHRRLIDSGVMAAR